MLYVPIRNFQVQTPRDLHGVCEQFFDTRERERQAVPLPSAQRLLTGHPSAGKGGNTVPSRRGGSSLDPRGALAQKTRVDRTAQSLLLRRKAGPRAHLPPGRPSDRQRERDGDAAKCSVPWPLRPQRAETVCSVCHAHSVRNTTGKKQAGA